MKLRLLPIASVPALFFSCTIGITSLISHVCAGVPLESFRNFETPHVSPLAISPAGKLLAACNTVDHRVEIFRLEDSEPVPVWEGSVAVGMDPVSARFRSERELWVVNQLSDSISIIDLVDEAVILTLETLDEPADVVFAGEAPMAFVSCSAANTVLVFDLDNLNAPPRSIAIEGEDPRTLAVSPDGTTVYAAVFESGNGTTILAGGGDEAAGGSVVAFPPNVVSSRLGPYRGQNPPPNRGDTFFPEFNSSLPQPPNVGLIVRQDLEGQWMDDNGGDWTELVSGEHAEESGRPEGWELIDNDLAIIDTETLDVTYAKRMMNICMSVGVNPVTGTITVIGTDATNEIRFEPVLNGTFVRVHGSTLDPSADAPGEAASVFDLNPHLDYSSHTTTEANRLQSIGDPRGIAFLPDGSGALVTGMGSNNVIVLAADGTRASGTPAIPVGEGPTGIVLAEQSNTAYVLNRFEGSISVVDLASSSETSRVPFFDPTPDVIRKGRRHLYDTHATSGLGQASCASCHVDSRIDRLAWDLGNPAGQMKPLGSQHNLGADVPLLNQGFDDFHP